MLDDYFREANTICTHPQDKFYLFLLSALLMFLLILYVFG